MPQKSCITYSAKVSDAFLIKITFQNILLTRNILGTERGFSLLTNVGLIVLQTIEIPDH